MIQRAWVSPMGALWTVTSDARQVVTAYGTREDAIDAARALLAATGGGELVVKGRDGQAARREPVAQVMAGWHRDVGSGDR